VGDFTNSIQQHDFEPGIEPSGLFWTTPVAPSAIRVDEDDGTARLRVRNIAVPDFHDFFNAVSPNPTSVRSHVSFDVRWHPNGSATSIRDETFGFSGTFIPGDAAIDFTARHDGSGVVYRSDPAGQHTISGGVGRERNGIFFH
jgi:hypothetical protein